MFMPMVRLLFVAKATITTCLWPRFVQIDEYLRMAKRTVAAVADSLTTLGHSYGLLCDKGHCAEWLGLELHYRLLEARAIGWRRAWSLVR